MQLQAVLIFMNFVPRIFTLDFTTCADLQISTLYSVIYNKNNIKENRFVYFYTYLTNGSINISVSSVTKEKTFFIVVCLFIEVFESHLATLTFVPAQCHNVFYYRL